MEADKEDGRGQADKVHLGRQDSDKKAVIW